MTTDVSAASRADTRAHLLIAGLVALHVVVALFLVLDPTLRNPEYASRSDAARYYEIATKTGVPYADFPVEYPPVVVAASKVLAFGSFGSFVVGVVVLSVTCDLAIAAVLRRTWGRTAAIAYLVLAAPMLPIGLTRLDWLAAALAVVAMAATLQRRGQVVAGTALALGALTKVWPGALALVFVARRRWQALSTFVVIGILGALAWVGVGGFDALRQVTTYRGATGWHVESLPGTVIVAVSGGPARFESGAWRVGHLPTAAGAALLASGLAVLLALTVALRRSAGVRRPETDAGSMALASVAVVMATATLLSPQFFVWLLPWAAVAFASGERRAPTFVLVSVLATVAAETGWPPEEFTATAPQLAFWIRNLALVATAVTAAVPMLRRQPAALEPTR